MLPTIEASPASGGIIKVTGITGRIRGMKHKRADGKTTRPSLVLLDDPQTDESARSPSQCAAREQILAGAILGLAGPGRKISGLMTLTVVRPDDMADRILNREKHPEWQANARKWSIRSRPPKSSGSGTPSFVPRASAAAGEHRKQPSFTADIRAEMDEGALVAWPQRHNPDELSAIQHAMNLKLDHGEAAFWAEYQNEPLPKRRVILMTC